MHIYLVYSMSSNIWILCISLHYQHRLNWYNYLLLTLHIFALCISKMFDLLEYLISFLELSCIKRLNRLSFDQNYMDIQFLLMVMHFTIIHYILLFPLLIFCTPTDNYYCSLFNNPCNYGRPTNTKLGIPIYYIDFFEQNQALKLQKYTSCRSKSIFISL